MHRVTDAVQHVSDCDGNQTVTVRVRGRDSVCTADRETGVAAWHQGLPAVGFNNQYSYFADGSGMTCSTGLCFFVTDVCVQLLCMDTGTAVTQQWLTAAETERLCNLCRRTYITTRRDSLSIADSCENDKSAESRQVSVRPISVIGTYV